MAIVAIVEVTQGTNIFPTPTDQIHLFHFIQEIVMGFVNTILIAVIHATPRESFNRYNTLLEMIQYYSPGFDERKYFQYGCHCIIREDQLDKSGIGKPVDTLDGVCRKFKNCQKVKTKINLSLGKIEFDYFLNLPFKA